MPIELRVMLALFGRLVLSHIQLHGVSVFGRRCSFEHLFGDYWFDCPKCQFASMYLTGWLCSTARLLGGYVAIHSSVGFRCRKGNIGILYSVIVSSE